MPAHTYNHEAFNFDFDVSVCRFDFRVSLRYHRLLGYTNTILWFSIASPNGNNM
ncbi:hypothetical protein QTP88_019067 [Uroleucon formosanum]